MSKPVPTIKVLRAARKLIANKKTWTGFVAARDKYGNAVGYSDPAATRFCALGAIWREAGACSVSNLELDSLHRALDTLARRYGHASLPQANDFGGQACALKVIDAAIAELEGA